MYLETSFAGSEHPPGLSEHDVADRAADLLIPSASSRAEVHEIYEAAFRTPGTALIPVDGKSIEFLLVERGSEFAAVARTGELFVSLLVENGDPRDIKLATSANR